VCCSVLQCVAVCCSELQGGVACCSELQSGAMSCSVLQCVAMSKALHASVPRGLEDACNLGCVAVCCSVLR